MLYSRSPTPAACLHPVVLGDGLAMNVPLATVRRCTSHILEEVMRRITGVIGALLPAVIVACSNGDVTREPTSPLSASPNTVQAQRIVEILDICDSASFNAVLGPGTCVRSASRRLTFQQFIHQLETIHTVPTWRNAPTDLHVAVGTQLVAKNFGGEAHTFTEVAAFGGGIVPQLNRLSNNPVPAPECLTLAPTDFLPPRGQQVDDVDAAGTELYQCCIHPWMRTTVHAH
jgi:hypothetical protein